MASGLPKNEVRKLFKELLGETEKPPRYEIKKIHFHLSQSYVSKPIAMLQLSKIIFL